MHATLEPGRDGGDENLVGLRRGDDVDQSAVLTFEYDDSGFLRSFKDENDYFVQYEPDATHRFATASEMAHFGMRSTVVYHPLFDEPTMTK